jgi:hypothetical protein
VRSEEVVDGAALKTAQAYIYRKMWGVGVLLINQLREALKAYIQSGLWLKSVK